MSEYLVFACAVAKKAGAAATKVFSRAFQTKYKTEGDYQSPVTEADGLCEKIIISSIKKKFPSHGIVSEESGEFKSSEEYVWLIDPIDGTRNFSHKIPRFSISIALVHKGDVLCGAVYDPCMKELFSAEKGVGAFLNRRRISVSGTSDVKSAIISLDGAMAPDVKRQVPKNIEKILPNVEAIRIFAGAALDLSWSACGRLDGIVNHKCHSWDVAAGGIILKEAGGIIEDALGIEKFPFMTKYVAGNPAVAKSIIRMIRV